MYKWKQAAVYEAVSSLLVTTQRKEIHKMIVDGFQRQTESGVSLSKGEMHFRMAIHCMKAGRYGDAHDAFLRAASYAERMYRFDEALRLYKEAIGCQNRMNTEHDSKELLPTLLMGDCYRKVARYQEARSALESCLEEIEKYDTGD